MSDVDVTQSDGWTPLRLMISAYIWYDITFHNRRKKTYTDAPAHNRRPSQCQCVNIFAQMMCRNIFRRICINFAFLCVSNSWSWNLSKATIVRISEFGWTHTHAHIFTYRIKLTIWSVCELKHKMNALNHWNNDNTVAALLVASHNNNNEIGELYKIRNTKWTEATKRCTHIRQHTVNKKWRSM